MSREISPKTRRLFKKGAADLRRQKREQAAGRERIVLQAEMLAAERFAWRRANEIPPDADTSPLQFDYLSRGWHDAMAPFDDLGEIPEVHWMAGWILHAMEHHGEEQADG